MRQLFTAWLDSRGGEGSIEIKEACQRIEHLFVSNQHGDRVGDASNPVNVRNLLAYKSHDLLADTTEFWVPTAIFNKELADGVDKSELIKELLKREWLTKGDRADRHTNRRTMDKRQQSFFVFTPFWLDRNSQSIIEKTEKSTDLTDLTDYESCNGVNSTFQSSPNLVRNENDNGLNGLNPHLPEIKSVKSVDENQSVLERTNPEPIDSKGSSSSSPLSPLSPHKKQTSSNAPEKNHKHSSEFKVSDLVKPSDPYHERGQDTGIVESIEGEQYVVQWQSDSNVRRYTRDELQLAAWVQLRSD